MQRIGFQCLAFGVVRGAMQRAGAPEIHRDIDQEHDKGDGRYFRRRRVLAQTAPGFDENAAGEHIQHRDHAERGDALELAMAVMMLLVGGAVGNPHHHPGDDGRDHIDRRVQGLRDQRETADRDADDELRRCHAGAGKHGNRGDAGFYGVIGMAHGPGCSRASCNIKDAIDDVSC